MRAQSQSDGSFGKITCTELEIRKDGELAMILSAGHHGGHMTLYGKGGFGGVHIGNNEHGRVVTVRSGAGYGGTVRISFPTEEHGGVIGVYSEGIERKAGISVDRHGEGKSQIFMGITEHGDPAIGFWEKNGFRLK